MISLLNKNKLPGTLKHKPALLPVLCLITLCFFTNSPASSADKNVAASKKNASNYSLAALEQAVESSPAVISEIALLEELQAQLNHEQKVIGWKIVGSARGGYTNEQLSSNKRKEYYPAQITAGLTYPLFGKYKDETANLLELEAVAENAHLKVELNRREALEQLRLSYIILWGTEKKIALAEAFLSSESNDRHVLSRRKDLGLILPSDYYDFITVLERVERERKVNMNAAERARDIIQLLTEIRIASPLAYVPDLPMTCENVDDGLTVLHQDPEILMYQNMVDLQLKKQRYLKNDVKGNFTVRGFVASSENVNTDIGYGGLVSLDVIMPLNPFAADASNHLVTQKRLRRYQQDLAAKTAEVKFNLTDRLRNFDSERSRKSDNARQLQARTEQLRERTLRLDRVDGDVFEQYQQARYRYYRSAIDFVDGEIRFLQSAAKILRFCPEEATRKSLVSSETSVILPLETSLASSFVEGASENISLTETSIKPVTAVYLWDGAIIFDNDFSPLLFKKQSIAKILVSLDQGLLAYIKSAEGTMHLRQVLADCQKHGLTVSLLLGEPTWILPEFRDRLMEILQGVNQFNFASVHLDMEPSQLDVKNYGLEYLSAQLLRTTQVATEVSEHPIEVSIHPRLLDKQQTTICFGCGLSNLPLNRVVVMIYRTDHKSVAEQMASFSKEYPKIQFAIAQSVEPSLGFKNSYAHQDREVFEKVRQDFIAGDVTAGWHGDVYIQDWVSYTQFLKASKVK
ncbi:hypothetical protein [Desulfosediminicola ganghwensis]|uniref:hypothetical protein n=1 Tax=Desulfosediminicola ganghwensis TaxID=2569540 RepID=UPI0010ABB75F|nr:hypothetical protein [Desulfosediminicola ganghwensis]